MSKVKIVAFVGLPFTGKSTAREVIVELLDKQNIPNNYVYFGAVGEVERRNAAKEWEPEQADLTFQQKEQYIRELWRKESGMGVMAIKAMPEIEKYIKAGKLVLIDNLYSEEEREILVEKYGEDAVVLVALAADWMIRVRRAKNRKERPLSEDELKKRDDAEIRNIHKAPPIVRAQVTIVNNGDEASQPEQARKFLQTELETRVLPLLNV